MSGMATRTRRAIQRLLLPGVAVLGVGCSQHQDLMMPGGGPVVEIEIRNFAFSPSELRVAPGTTVRWRNATSNYHTVTPDGHTAWTEWQTASAGEMFEARLEAAGTYPYFCVPHRSLGMTGTIIVQ